METDLIGPHFLGDRGMPGNILVKRGNISDEVDTLLKITHKTRCQADPLHTHPLQFVRDVIMFSMAGWAFCFVYRNFQFKWLASAGSAQVLIHFHHVPDRVPVFHHCFEQDRFSKMDRYPLNGARAVQQVALGLSQCGRQVHSQDPEIFQAKVVSLIIHIFARINRKEGEASRQAGVYVGFCF